MAIAPVVAVEGDGEFHQTEGHEEQHRQDERERERFELDPLFEFVELARAAEDGEQRASGQWRGCERGDNSKPRRRRTLEHDAGSDPRGKPGHHPHSGPGEQRRGRSD